MPGDPDSASPKAVGLSGREGAEGGAGPPGRSSNVGALGYCLGALAGRELHPVSTGPGSEQAQ